MRILAIESSTRQIGVAISERDEILAHQITNDKIHSATTITVLIRDCLRHCKLQPNEIDAVAVSLGPGSFTGLRIGCVTAKIWAYACQSNIISVPTHEAIAQQAMGQLPPNNPLSLWVCTDAQRNQVFLSHWTLIHQQLTALNSIDIVDATQLGKNLRTGDFITGSGLNKPTMQQTGVTIIDSQHWTPLATTIAKLAWERAKTMQFDDLWSLKPLYVRLSAAEEKTQQD